MPLTKQLPDAYTTLAWVTFELEQGPRRVEFPSPATTLLPGIASLYSVQTQKSLSHPEGKFQVRLAALGDTLDDSTSWINTLHTNDKVEIRLARIALTPGSLPDVEITVMVGLIDHVNETRGVDARTGQPVQIATVTGTDYAKLFRQTKVTHDLWLVGENDALLIAKLLEIPNKLTDAEQIAEILKWVNDHDMMDLHFGTDDGSISIYGSNNGETHALNLDDFAKHFVFHIADGSYSSYQGDLWGMLEQLANKPFCELYLDTIRNQPTLVFRATPFGPPGPLPKWPQMRQLKTHRLNTRQYWSTRSLQRSDSDLFNVFQVYEQQFHNPVSVFPIKVPESLRLYGLRYFAPAVTIISQQEAENIRQQQIAAKNAGVEPPVPTEEEVKKAAAATDAFYRGLSETAAEWFGRKTQFEQEAKKQREQQQPILFKNGVIPITLSPEIRIGQAALFTDLNEIYYIEGVTHHVQVKGQGQTVLTLTRGQKL